MPTDAAMLPPPLSAALAAGATIVTPNKRLARELVARHDAGCRFAGLRAWPAASVLPWQAWLHHLRQDALGAGGAAPARLMGAAESAFLWQHIVATDAMPASPLIDSTGVAALAAEAWDVVHAWGAGGESWRGWSGGDDEPAAFARWADRYSTALGREAALDLARLPDELARLAPNAAAGRGAGVLMAGFVELSPQQQRLLAALAAAGMRIEHCAMPAIRHAGAHRVSAADPRTEIAMALAWGRAQVHAKPEARVGVAVADLAARRAEVRALAEDILCPALQWPGREDEPRPYELSLGEPLADVPLVAAALASCALLAGPLPRGEAAAWLRSPYLAGRRDAWLDRASLEADWIEEGRENVTLGGVLERLAVRDGELSARMRDARRRSPLPARATPRAWIGIWRAWLAATGWPGERVLASAEFQARRAFDETLTAFASITSAELRQEDAIASLRAHVGSLVFQPEGTEAPIRILGLLEAAGLAFDALWVTGLTAATWPPAPRPNPLLPLAWQLQRDVPHASARRGLAFARALTEQLAGAAPMVIMSHAEEVDDHPGTPSALIEHLPPWPGPLPMAEATSARAFAARPALDWIADDRAPPHRATGRTRGGASLIEAQSDCPFKAQAAYRLRADPWPVAPVGLTPAERGNLVHATLAAFWREVGDHASFVALGPDALDAVLARATNAALAGLDQARARMLPPLVAAGEAARLARAARDWLESVERQRPAFRVRDTELPVPLRLGRLELGLRLDRVDDLDGGGCAIIDYKTGAKVSVARWFAPRPEAPQLGLYALGLRAAAPASPVRAVAFAHVRPGECATRGIAADASVWPALSSPRTIGAPAIATWADIQQFWSDRLGALAEEFVAGLAAVDPRQPGTTCHRCGRMALCRVSIAPDADEAEAIDDPDG